MTRDCASRCGSVFDELTVLQQQLADLNALIANLPSPSPQRAPLIVAVDALLDARTAAQQDGDPVLLAQIDDALLHTGKRLAHSLRRRAQGRQKRERAPPGRG